MTKRILLICLLTYFSLIAQDSNIIKWTNETKLSWSDYSASPDTTSWIGAISKCGITFSTFSASNELFIFEVYSTFDKNSSWVWREKVSDFTLIHEQGHFNLTEVYARKFRKKLSTINLNVNTIDLQIGELIKQFTDSLNQNDSLYDFQTEFSLNIEKQNEWNLRINKELKNLEKNSSPFVYVRKKSE